MLEQTATEQEQTSLVGDQPAAVPSTETEAASVAQTAAAVPFEFQSDEDIRKFAEQNERLRSYLEKQRLDGEHAGRQKRDKELRLERGDESVAREYQRQLLDRYGVEISDEDLREAPSFIKANRDRERVDYWTTHTNAVLDAYDARERENITNALSAFEGEPDQIEQISRQVIDEAVKRQSGKRVSELTLADIPAESKLYQSIKDYMGTEMAKEAAAQAQEKEAPPPPPRVPVGDAARGKTKADYASLTPNQIANLPDDEYRIAMGYAG
jgi:hypothetical protein